ncbi:MAG: MerR family transcriptional regulator [Deltaproteobacteria bacterium]|nr:MAG: MerR family transcriptional regulator [Deltaproteobacteria bacterium]
MTEEQDNVIHVRFGKDGNAEVSNVAQAAPPSEPAAPSASRRERHDDPLADLYSMDEVARVFGLKVGRLRYWDRSGFIKPSGRSGRRRFYTFLDLIGLRVAKGLLDGGMTLQQVRKSVDALKTNLPKVVRPLSELRVTTDGTTVVVQGENGTFEPTTGQMVLDFEVSALRDDVVRVLDERRIGAGERQRAYDLYLEGCRLDEDDATSGRAADLYQQALALDPALSNAITNLGNLRFREGDLDESELLYQRALTVDPAQPEAHYNLGFLAFERGDAEAAVPHFEQALEQDPSFADAHFNLAMALEELGRGAAARPHWDTYLRLDPSGPWAEVARRHLSRPEA